MTTLSEIVRWILYSISNGYLRVAGLVMRRDRLLLWSERKFRALLESAPDAMIIVDLHGHVQLVNVAAEKIFGYSRTQMIGQNIGDLVPSRVRGEHRAHQDRCLTGPGDEPSGHIFELFGRRADGTEFPVEISLSPLETMHGVLVSNAIRDISQRKGHESQLQHLADHDGLTGLLNRRNFEERLVAAIAATAVDGVDGVVMLVDIDGLKDINDTLGHAAGDELVCSVGALVAANLGELGDVARLGGDEFGVLLTKVSVEAACEAARALLDTLRERPLIIGGQRVRHTASVGVASFGETDAREDVMVAADLALYEAKQAGRDRVVVHASTDVEVIERRTRASWTQRIRTAIDDDLLVAYRQPIMDLDTRQVRQYELLVRMLDEDGTAIPPGAFLAVAERTGMILEIDRMMVAKAIALIAASEAAGDPISYEVNLSARSLADPLLPGVIASRVAESGIEPSLLVFEITETAAIANFDQARDFANALRRLGCRFALDDFGAGFASFFYLKHMPLDCLKIDGDFIRDLTQNRVDKIVVRHLAEIARELGMITIAEFVEDEATLELLVTYGIDHAQGYHIGRPEPVPAGADSVAFFAGLADDRSEVAEEPRVASSVVAA